MRRLIQQGLSNLPAPGRGQTLARWRALAAVGAIDLSLAKLYEGHTDALAILAELGERTPEGLGAVWAAEPPHTPLVFEDGYLSGIKKWCSGASTVDFALLTARTTEDRPILVQTALQQEGVNVDLTPWRAVGMASSQSGSVTFTHVPAAMVGQPGDYLARPGFWQGGAGIAAVWLGGAIAIARTLATSHQIPTDEHASVHLGAVDTALSSARALLIETADWIDAHPQADAAAPALRLRAAVEAACEEVLTRTGRALGPAPLCCDPVHAQRCADLSVFLRQSHAERDLAELGRLTRANVQHWTF